MANLKRTAEEVVAATEGSGGIKGVIAQRLKIHRHSVDNYLGRYASAMQAYENECQLIADLAESTVINDIRQHKNVETSKWYLRMKARDRGYVEKQQQEITGAAGGPIEVKAVDYRAAIAPITSGPVRHSLASGKDESAVDGPQVG